MKALVSIIIPTYNRAHIITETLETIIAQEYSNWECIIVDDGSTDETEKLMSNWTDRDSRFKFYIRPNSLQKGPSSCRNFGFSKSIGEFVQFFDSDDLYKPKALEVLVSKFTDRIDAVVAKIELMEMETSRVLKENQIKSVNIIEDHFFGNISFYVCGPMWTRSFLENQPFLFNERLSNGDDWDFNLRMLYSYPRLVLLDSTYVSNRVHSRSLSKERNRLNIEELKSYFNALRYHQQAIRGFSNSEPIQFENFVINKHLSFLRIAVNQNNNFKYTLFKITLTLLFSFKRYWLIFKITIGLLSNLIFGRGYRLLKL